MPYINFSTEKADYVLNAVNHIYSPRDLNRFRGLDALVVESGDQGEEFIRQDTWEESLFFVSLLGTKGVARQVREDNIPIYSVDVNSQFHVQSLIREIIYPRYILSPILSLLPALLYSLFRRELPSLVQQYLSFFEQFERHPSFIGRSAISAEKIEGYLVDIVAEEKGVERPRIGIVYGIGHASLVDLLKSEDLRRKHLERLHESNFKGLNKDQLNKVFKYSYSREQEGWIRSAWDVDLFET